MAEQQETAMTLYRGDDEWLISTSDTTIKNLLARRGYEADTGDGLYSNYRLPQKAITIRSRASLGSRKGNPANFRAASVPGPEFSAPLEESETNGGADQ